MSTLKNLFNEFIDDESGLTAVEYAIAGALVVAGLVTAFTDLGTAVDDEITDLCTAVDSDGDNTCR